MLINHIEMLAAAMLLATGHLNDKWECGLRPTLPYYQAVHTLERAPPSIRWAYVVRGSMDLTRRIKNKRHPCVYIITDPRVSPFFKF